MAAVAIVKNPGWAESVEIPSPLYFNEQWTEQPRNSRVITIWENFEADSIMADFYATLEGTADPFAE
jgi:hypothetical protein